MNILNKYEMLGKWNVLIFDALLKIFSFDKQVKSAFNKNIRYGTILW
jgi:hypothetical protein